METESGQAQNNADKRPSRLHLPSDRASKYDVSDIVDKEKLNREQNDLNDQLRQLGEKIRPYADGMQEKDATTWDRTIKNNANLLDTRQYLDKALEGREDLFTVDLSHLMETTRSFLTIKNFERLHHLTHKYGFLHIYEPFVEIGQFELGGATGIKIAGISVKDVIDNPDISPVSFYKFLVEANTANTKKDHSKVIQENQTSIEATYPNSTKRNVDDAIHQIVAFQLSRSTALLSLDQVVSRIIGLKEKKEFLHAVVQMAKRINILKQNIFDTIFDPNSSDFSPLMEAAKDYLSKDDQDVRVDALLQLGLDTSENVTRAFRKARELNQQDNKHSSFYALLERSIKQYLEDIPQELGILTNDDLPLFIDLDKPVEDKSIPTPEDLRKFTGAIFQMSLTKEYVVDPQTVNLANFIPPTSVSVEFPKGHSRIFNVRLHYENEQGESTALELNFDTRRNIFDWKPFIEATNDPEMAELRKAALLASHSILSQIQQQTEAEYQQKQKEREAKTQIPQPTTRQSRPKEPYVPREKVAREKRTRPLTPFQEALQSETSFPIQPERQRIKNQITLSSNEDLDKMIGNLSEEDRRLVIEGIEEYNQRGVGQFKILRLSGKEGQPLFTLRVNCGTGGGIRVLMHEVHNPTEGGNTRAFEIVDIDYRKNIYRKRGL